MLEKQNPAEAGLYQRITPLGFLATGKPQSGKAQTEQRQ